MTDHDYTNLILEDMNSKFDVLVEGFGQVRAEIHTLAKQSDLEEVKSDIKVIKVAVTDLSSQVNNHEERITALEIS